LFDLGKDLLHFLASTDNLLMLILKLDFFPQVDVLLLQPLLQARDLPEIRLELLLHLLSGEGVGKHLRNKPEALLDPLRPGPLLPHDSEGQQAKGRLSSN
jgi:hypothetical protein